MDPRLPKGLMQGRLTTDAEAKESAPDRHDIGLRCRQGQLPATAPPPAPRGKCLPTVRVSTLFNIVVNADLQVGHRPWRVRASGHRPLGRLHHSPVFLEHARGDAAVKLAAMKTNGDSFAGLR